ncbi:hypothetical protein GOB87_11770 [Acetobacter estunensis]|uniref:Helix-turn-helix domain-containing protein n=1 Tax=Acetobacter estunensis TaxID=104097 RepID=A0A967B8F5_9PROT|nr:hypothetical protein [Acetobacter estunensis]
MNNKRTGETRFLNISNVCKNYGIGRTYCYKLLSDGHIQAKKLGGRTLVSVESLNTYFSSLPDYRPGATI